MPNTSNTQFINFGRAVFTAPVAPADLTVTVDDGTAFPPISGPEYFYAVFEKQVLGVFVSEVVIVTDVTGNVLTVTRAVGGTVAEDFAVNDIVENRVTMGTLDEFANQIELNKIGGSDTNIQFNNAGLFEGVSSLRYNLAIGELTVGPGPLGDPIIRIDADATGDPKLFFSQAGADVAIIQVLDSTGELRIESNADTRIYANNTAVAFFQAEGMDLRDGGIRFLERADHAFTPAPGFGEVWVNSAGGDLYYTDGAGVDYNLTAAAASGDVVGPAGATDNAVARYDTATGKLIQDSIVLIDDAGNITGVTTLNGTDPADFGLVDSVAGGTNINVTGTAADPIVNLDAAITGVSVNGVTLNNAGAATSYLDETGAYSIPPAAQFGEYSGEFDASIGTFPVTTNQGDWFNTTVAGTVDGQAFIVGDLLIALVDSPSTITFAGNWSIVPNIQQAAAGNDTEIQYNNAGAFGATSDFTISPTILRADRELDIRNAFGVVYIYDNANSGNAAQNRILFRDSVSFNLGNIGYFDGDGSLSFNNEQGDVKIKSQSGQVFLQETDTDVARTINEAAGGFEVNNTLTGAGFERVLTISDLAGAAGNTNEIQFNTAGALDADPFLSVDLTAGSGQSPTLKLDGTSGFYRNPKLEFNYDASDYAEITFLEEGLLRGYIQYWASFGGRQDVMVLENIQTGIIDDTSGAIELHTRRGTSRQLRLKANRNGVGIWNGNLQMEDVVAPLHPDTLGYGQIWIDSADNLPYYRNQAGLDFPLTAVGNITGSIADNQIAVGAATADEIEGSADFTWDGVQFATKDAGQAVFEVQQNQLDLYSGDVGDQTAADGIEVLMQWLSTINTYAQVGFNGDSTFEFRSFVWDGQIAFYAQDAAGAEFQMIEMKAEEAELTFLQDNNAPVSIEGDTGSTGALAGALLVKNGATFYLEEIAAAQVDSAGSGQIWVKNDIPNTLWFTDDAGTDWLLNQAVGTIGGSITDNQVAIGAATANEIEGDVKLTFDTASSTLTVRSFAELQDLTNQDPTASDTIEANIKLTSLDDNLFGFIGLDGNDSLDFIHYAYDGIIRLLTTDANGSDYGIEIGPAFFQLQSAVGGSFEQIIVTDSDSAATVADVDIEMKSPVTFDFGLIVAETADHPRAPSAGSGQIWVRSSDSKPIFTDDSGTDFDLTDTGAAGISGSGAVNQLAVWDGVSSVTGYPRLTFNNTINFFSVGDQTLGQPEISLAAPAGGIPKFTWRIAGLEEAIVRWNDTNSDLEFDIGATNIMILDADSVELNNSTLFIEEIAAAGADRANYGQFWVRNDTPNTPMFTDDAGNDFVLNATGTGDVVGPASSVDDRIATFDGVTGKLIQDSGTLVSDLALAARDLIAGDGLSGGGDLTADRTFTVNTQNSIDIQADNLELLNDEASPGNHHVYGTDGAGTKGWQERVFGTEFEQGISLGEQSTTSATYVTAYTFTSASVPAGDYKLEWFCDIGEKTDKESSHRVLIDGVEVSNNEWRIKEGTENDGVAWLSMSGHRILTLTAATHTIEFQYRTDDTAYIRNMQASIFRVA